MLTVLEVRVLGPLVVSTDRGGVTPASRAQRLLLAMLVMAHGRVVSPTRLSDGLWGEEQPADPLNALQSHISRLRSRLGDKRVLVTTETGYGLDIPEGAVDAGRFERLVEDGARLPAGKAAECLSEALGLWRGPAYGEFNDHHALAGEARRLDELRLVATERWCDAQLSLGRHAEIAGRLESLVSEHPLRERFWLLLATALDRSGRQADALDALNRCRATLRELGLDPSPRATELYERILTAPEPAQEPRPRVGHIPKRSTAILGRERDVRGVRRLLERARIVTITGTGGVGKTSLALAVADACRPAFHDGVWLVELGSLAEPEAVVPSLTSLFGLASDPADPLLTVRAWLQRRSAMLVLDNCEHLVDSVATLVEDLATTCHDLVVLATSREPLGVEGEHLWPLEPLDLEIAVKLFAERARAVDPGFELDDSIRDDTKELCRSLDGIPLAIEMAAARLRTLPPRELVRGLDRRLDLLRSHRRTAPRRQQTLRATVAWSYDLLPPATQRLFRRLAVFAGRFAIEAAGEVASERDHTVVADLVADLVDRSLIVAEAGTHRFRLLETIRAFAAEQLALADEDSPTRQRHAAWAVGRAQKISAGLRGPDEARWVTTIETELDDLRSAHRWAIDTGNAQVALRLFAPLYDFAYQRNRADILAWVEPALALPGAGKHPLAGRAHAVAALAAIGRGDTASALALAEAALAGDPDPATTAAAHQVLSDAAMYSGDLDAAVRHGHEVVRAADELGDVYQRCIGTVNVALCHAYAGHAEPARAAAASLSQHAASIGNPTCRAWADYADGEIAMDDDPQAALESLKRSIDRANGVGNHLAAGVATVSATSLRARHGEPRAALASFDRVIEHWAERADWTHQWTTLRNLVALLARMEEHEPAAVLYGAVTGDFGPPSFGAEQQRLDEALAQARAVLPPAEVDAALARGTAMTPAETVAYARRQASLHQR